MLDVEGLLRRLTAAGVRYIIVGGFAVIAHGVIRATKDLDICPAPDRPNLERLAEVLAGLHAKHANAGDFDPSELPHDPANPDDLAQGGNFQLETDLGNLDVMQWISGIDAELAYHVLQTEAIKLDWHALTIDVASLEHVKAMKRTAGRPQDLKDLADLKLANG
jgi:hypothetical protein